MLLDMRVVPSLILATKHQRKSRCTRSFVLQASQGSGSTYTPILICRDSGDQAVRLRTTLGTTIDVDDSSDSGRIAIAIITLHLGGIIGGLRQKTRMIGAHSQETFRNVSSCSEVKAVQLSMDSRRGLTEFPLAPVETNVSKSHCVKVPSVT